MLLRTRSPFAVAILASLAAAGALVADTAQPPAAKTAQPPRQLRIKPPATQAARITQQTVTLTRGDSKFTCYVARPAGDRPAPGLVLIHEWWGLNDWVKQQADRYAEMGYVALAPDLYHGDVASDAEHAHELMRGLTDERALGDLQAAFEYLAGPQPAAPPKGTGGGAGEPSSSQDKGKGAGAARPSKTGGGPAADGTAYCRGQPIGVMGWCMGGGFALRLASAEPRVACTVVCYGKPVTDVEQLRKIRGPLLGIWGATDRGIDVPPFQKALDEAKVHATHHVFPGAGHAFLNETNKQGYNKEQAQKAWAEIDGFLKAGLKP
jgi:carboxymethylenebutenolidase